MLTRIFVLLLSLISLASFAQGPNTYTEITLPQLMKKKQQGDKNMVIVDVRSAGEFGDSSRGKSGNIGRIKGAIHLNVQDLQNKPDAVKQLDAYRNKDIYLICSHSYRSRTASNILLKNGFTHVSNVQGGMTEWYRRYDELVNYRGELYDADILYKNLSPVELLNDLVNGKTPLLVGIRNNPRVWWDSANVRFYQQFPLLRNAVYYDYADSLKLLQDVQKNKDRPVVLFNMVNNGAAELAEWLTLKGIPNASYLVGGPNLFYEYAANQQNPAKTDRYFIWQNDMRVITPLLYCKLAGGKNVQLIDIRHDSLFNKVNEGVKHKYTHLKNAINFFADKGADQFEVEFPDKSKEYVFMNAFGGNGMDLAIALTKKGYKVSWLNGGFDRWEWYMNNVEDFGCNDFLLE